MSRRVIFHIGLHKTATTLLQTALFPHLPNIEYRRTEDFDLINELIASHDSPLLISHETLSGDLSPKRSPGARLKKLRKSLSNIVATGADASIVVGFRQQMDWLNSAFAERSKSHAISREKFVGSFATEELLWCEVIRILDESTVPFFGFIYEELLHRPDIFIEDLCRFIGTTFHLDPGHGFSQTVNPSPRSVGGRRITQLFYALAKKLKLTPYVDTSNLRHSCRRAGLKLGMWVDRFAAPAQPIRIDPALACLLRQDWNDLVDLIGERRGRDFSTLCYRVE